MNISGHPLNCSGFHSQWLMDAGDQYETFIMLQRINPDAPKPVLSDAPWRQ